MPERAWESGRKIVPLAIKMGFRPVDILTRPQEAFNLSKFQWLSDELLDPSQLKAVYKGESLTHVFRGFSTEGR
jgi:hypothetical protein